MVVWFSSGLPPHRVGAAGAALCAAVVVLIAALSLFVAPWAQKKSVEYKEQLSNRDDVSRVAPGLFRESSGGEQVFFIEALSGEEKAVPATCSRAACRTAGSGVMVASEGHTEVDATGNR